jgi:hypothetical protein
MKAMVSELQFVRSASFAQTEAARGRYANVARFLGFFLLSSAALTSACRGSQPSSNVGPPSDRSSTESAAPSGQAIPNNLPSRPPAAPDSSHVEGDTKLEQLAVVSDDSKFVAAAIRVADGARGNDNFAVGLFDVDADRIVEKVVIVDPNNPEKGDRVEQANRARALLDRYHWQPLKRFETRDDPEAPVRQGGAGAPVRAQLAEGEGVRVTYREPTLVVRETASGQELLRKDFPRFSVPAGTRCQGCPRCPAPLADLASAFGNRARNVLLLVIRYHGGSDVCWEPDESFHVLRVSW